MVASVKCLQGLLSKAGHWHYSALETYSLFRTAPDKQRPTYVTRRERITKDKRQQEKGKKPLHWWRYSLVLNEENNFNIFPKCPPDENPPCSFQYETVQMPLFWAECVVCGHWGEKLNRQLMGGWLKMVRFGPTGPPMVCFLPTRRQKNANFEMILIMFLFWYRRVENMTVPFKG